MCCGPARTPGIPQIGWKGGPKAPQISSDCPRKSLDFEMGAGWAGKRPQIYDFQSPTRENTNIILAALEHKWLKVTLLASRPTSASGGRGAGEGGGSARGRLFFCFLLREVTCKLQ